MKFVQTHPVCLNVLESKTKRSFADKEIKS